MPNIPNPFDLTGRVALVTGAYRGLGFSIARGLAAAGARVILNGRNADALGGAVGVLAGEGLAADVALFDVTDADAVRQGVADAARRSGPIDVLVNNAGIQRRHALVDFPQHDWDAIIATNLTAPYLVSQAVLPGMIAAQARQDHPHRVADERTRAAERGALHGGKRRHPPTDPRDGSGARAAQHPGQRDSARLLRHRNESRAARRREVQRVGEGAHARGTLGRARRRSPDSPCSSRRRRRTTSPGRW